MINLPFTERKRNISILIEQISKALNVTPTSLSPIREKLEKIVFNNDTLDGILSSYYALLESEMASLIGERITPGFQFGIKNQHFTFIGYQGRAGANEGAKAIDESTYFSFDSISKILISIVTMLMIRDGSFTLKSSINSYNPEFNMDATIESILKFTAMIQTEKRIDNLSRRDTIDILKKCRENITEKKQFKNYYQYNDIGYMMLRLSIPDFLERLDTILKIIDLNNLTYRNLDFRTMITGGKWGEEFITPDPKGRDILFPGHTGLYGNMTGLLNMFDKIFNEDIILTSSEKEILLRQPYDDPRVYTKEGKQLIGKNNSLQYMAKVAGVYRMPLGIDKYCYDKLASCDFSNLTTDKALASAGSCGSWVMSDNLTYQNKFGTYIGGILTNPYSYVKPGMYPNIQNIITNTGLIVNQKGVILGYSKKLDRYKEVICEYGILLELLTEYLKSTDRDIGLRKGYNLIKKM